MITPNEVKQWIEQGLSEAKAEVNSNDGVHFEALVVCPGFAGKSMLQQHKMVYEALGDKMQVIHALSLRTQA